MTLRVSKHSNQSCSVIFVNFYNFYNKTGVFTPTTQRNCRQLVAFVFTVACMYCFFFVKDLLPLRFSLDGEINLTGKLHKLLYAVDII